MIRSIYTIHIYTDGSKHENGVGSGIAMYTDDKLTHQIKYKLHNSCSNNQAEQTAILKALNTLGTIKLSQGVPRTAKIHTDSKIILLSLENPKNRKKHNRRNQKGNRHPQKRNMENCVYMH
jgi:ribonuclease HI